MRTLYVVAAGQAGSRPLDGRGGDQDADSCEVIVWVAVAARLRSVHP